MFRFLITLLSYCLVSVASADGVLTLATWPNYHDPDNFKRFEQATGIKVHTKVYGSNEEMMEWLLTGKSGFDVVVATNYAIAAYAKMGLIIRLKPELLSHYADEFHDARFVSNARSNKQLIGVPKNWGTTGFIYDPQFIKSNPTTWREFFELLPASASGHAVVHDYQLTAIGNALVALGAPFNSLDRGELARAEKLLLSVKPHLQAVSSLAYDELKKGAWIAMAWSGDAMLLSRERPQLRYVIARDGGEIWTDYFAITRESRQSLQAHALINFLLQPDNNAREVIAHGFAPTDKRVLPLLPDELRNSRVMFPDEEQIKNLAFGARDTLTDPRRAEILRKFSGK